MNTTRNTEGNGTMFAKLTERQNNALYHMLSDGRDAAWKMEIKLNEKAAYFSEVLAYRGIRQDMTTMIADLGAVYADVVQANSAKRIAKL